MGLKLFDRKFGRGLLKDVPASPGVYRYYGLGDELLYVGKARSLRKRLAQYRTASRKKRQQKMRQLVREAARLEWETCPSHLAACLREIEIIRDRQPIWNISGAYWFMYPLIGVCQDGDTVYLCYTTTPGAFTGQGYQWHGAYRSRRLTKDAFFGLCHLLGYVGHPVQRKNLTQEKYSYVYGFRDVGAPWLTDLARFWQGQSREVLKLLVLTLLEWAPARQAADRVQECVNALEKFYERETIPLAQARQCCACDDWPIAQAQRDALMVRWRETRAPSSTPPAPAPPPATQVHA